MSFLGEKDSLLKNWVEQKIQEGTREEYLPKTKLEERSTSPARKRKRTKKEKEIIAKVRNENADFVIDLSEEIKNNLNWWECESDSADEWRCKMLEAWYKIGHQPEEWTDYDWRVLWYHSLSEDANLPF